MLMIKGQIYRCQNRSCNCEVTVVKPSVEGRSNPRCCCGAEMKKTYVPPEVRELSSDAVLAHQLNER
jgi:hypothetical protein